MTHGHPKFNIDDIGSINVYSAKFLKEIKREEKAKYLFYKRKAKELF